MEQQEEAIENFIVVGNPGAGKSTLLNGMIGRNAFLRGISIGSGKTFRFDKVIENRIRYCDTPGLDDPLLRQQAAEQIRLALQQDGYYRIVFVVTLEAGRVKPADKATIRLVLNATSQVTTSQYSIVVNKVSTPEARRLADPDQFSLLKTALFSQIPVVTDRIHLNKLDYELLDADDDSDVVMNMSDELRRFLREAPRIKVNSGQVSYIQWDEFERTVAAAEEANRRLKESQEEVKRERARVDKEIADAKALVAYEKARVDREIANAKALEKIRVDQAIAYEKARVDQEIANAKALEKIRVDQAIKALADEANAKALEQIRVDQVIANEKALADEKLRAFQAENERIIQNMQRETDHKLRVFKDMDKLDDLNEKLRLHNGYFRSYNNKVNKGKGNKIAKNGKSNLANKEAQVNMITYIKNTINSIVSEAKKLGYM